MAPGALSTSFVKTLGKTLCLALVAIAMDLVWGYTGILSLGHFAFFGLGGYMIGMWLMYARTEIIVIESMANAALPPTPSEISDAIGTQIFGVVGSSDFPLIWTFAHSFWAQIALVVLVPGILALVFGWLAFRSRVHGRLPLDPDTGDDAGALALPVPERQRACAATTVFLACKTCPARMRSLRTISRSGSSGPRPSRSCSPT